ncbi:MAG: polyphenol oxidase family protein [Syntrophobacteraceae bacterium]
MDQALSLIGPPRLTFRNLSRVPGLFHAIFTRRGGVSAPPFDSLNVAWDSGDLEEAVRENLSRIKQCAGVERLVSSMQVHGDVLNVIDQKAVEKLKPRPPILVGSFADALATRLSGVGLLIKTADCQSILLVDPQSRIIANIHSGWRGSIGNIAGKTVRSLERLGLNPATTLAAVSPSLGPCCAEFVNFKREIPEEFWPFMSGPLHFDFWALTRAQLAQAGIEEQNMEFAARCTVCEKSEFFSYRGEGKTGRMASVIGWQQP